MADMTGVSLIPTLDQVAERPEVLSQLPRATVLALYARVLSVERGCWLALADSVCGERGLAERRSRAADELLTADEVARLMGRLSRREIYRQAKHFPFSTFVVRPTPGTIRFRRDLVEEYLHDPDAYRVHHAGALAAGPATPLRRMGRRGG
jgi:hypothetical protein